MIGIALVLLSGGAYSVLSSRSWETPSGVRIVEVSSTPEASPLLVIHVCGAVKNEGVYSLPPGARINDAVLIAGGLLSRADTSKINLAEALKDGSKVSIPYVSPSGAIISANMPSSSSGPNRVNLNTADEAGLKIIPGIGQATAKSIIEYRLRNGPFLDIEDLKKIGGIGDKKLEKIRPHVTLN